MKEVIGYLKREHTRCKRMEKIYIDLSPGCKTPYYTKREKDFAAAISILEKAENNTGS